MPVPETKQENVEVEAEMRIDTRNDGRPWGTKEGVCKTIGQGHPHERQGAGDNKARDVLIMQLLFLINWHASMVSDNRSLLPRHWPRPPRPESRRGSRHSPLLGIADPLPLFPPPD